MTAQPWPPCCASLNPRRTRRLMRGTCPPLYHFNHSHRVTATHRAWHMFHQSACRALYHTLNAIRDDPAWWLGLTTQQALGVDYKSFDAVTAGGTHLVYGSSTLGVALTALLGLGDADVVAVAADGAVAATAAPAGVLGDVLSADRLGGVEAFMRGNGLPLMILLARFAMRRQAVFVSLPSGAWDAAAHAALVAGLARHPSIGMEPIPTALPPGGSPLLVSAFNMRDITVSRKQVVPFVDAILSGTAPWLA